MGVRLSGGTVARACDCAAVAEVAHVDGQGRVHVAAVTPLVWQNAPALALPYARAGLARALASAGQVSLTLSDSRLAYRGWQALGVSGAARVEEDRQGERFQAGLLAQELRKYPPSRALLDTPVLRREHWWYLPRWIVTVAPERVRALGRRAGPGDGVLVYARGGAVEADTVAVDAWEADEVVVRSLAGHPLDGVRGPATLFTHDFDVPDLERWVEASAAGDLAAGRLRVTARAGSRGLPQRLSLRGRLRRLRELERACRRELPVGP